MSDRRDISSRRPTGVRVALAFGAFLSLAAATRVEPASWLPQESGVKARFRGVSAVSDDVAWASGSKGTCVRSMDGGLTWKPVVVPDSATLDFRDVQAVNLDVAYLLSIGQGELSRIYKTTDAGKAWTLSYQNRDPKGFLDAIAFWDADHGLALGDPVDGRYVILRTDDGGKTWTPTSSAGMPEALADEGAFAASGTCLVVQGTSNAWFGTGGGSSARVFRSTDRGRTWSVANTPIHSGNASSGVFSLAFLDEQQGLAVGGNYKKPDDPEGNVALTSDGGKTWTLVVEKRPTGFRSAVVYLPGEPGPTLIAVGPTGSDRSTDGGRTWSSLGPGGFHALSFAGSKSSGWAVGEEGRISKFRP